MKIRKFCTGILFFSVIIAVSGAPDDIGFNKSEYISGYTLGTTVESLNESYGCSSLVKIYNHNAGRKVLAATACFCSGYKDGMKGKAFRYRQ
jgi:hypothetical protein